ncbi:MAG: formylmethanofuran dehydrogenase subunit E family protein [Candidatus Omnitrophica bacterium]|nr:formylmethanofuran dehydrogenase subunit E family protein [Candidatus Omnitrophota bacterium]
MAKNSISLRAAIKFHGHLGPYLVLGILAGNLAIKKLNCKKYFGLEVKVWGAHKKPRSCLVDGLQLSTGATYGKGNIQKLNGPEIKIEFTNCLSHKKLGLDFKDNLIRQLEQVSTHEKCELLAKKIFRINPVELFNLKLTT